MFWIEEFADLNAEYKDRLDKLLTTPLRAVDATQWTMVIKIGIFWQNMYLSSLRNSSHSWFQNLSLLLVCSWFDVDDSYGGYAGDS